MPIKKYLITGLLVWLPLAITVWVILWMVGILDGIFGGVLSGFEALLPVAALPMIDKLRAIHGLGVILVVLALLLTGALVSNVAGRWLVRQWDRLFTNIPIVKSIYNSVKKVSDTLFSSNGNAFRTALLIQYPRAGSWTIAFQTGTPSGEVQKHLNGEFVSVYVPTTPNPTSGFFLMLPRADVIELDMSVDEALTYVISMGSVAPQPTH
ncbi:putative membrane protein [Rhodoferax saidenbachensis]|uniref:Membrane protein n=1 Tax=Rhodoferax saidenbachensis TaxID=1484693 RepID=A0ABU1ZJ49_9BURK|nr:putative membrane protein [Rhodoferax saidenbachensis]